MRRVFLNAAALCYTQKRFIIVHLLDVYVSVTESAFMLHYIHRKQHHLVQCQKDLRTHASVAGNPSV